MNNKVKFNICNCHYALQSVAEDGEMTFDVPVAMPGAVSLALDPNGEPESFYADGNEVLVENANSETGLLRCCLSLTGISGRSGMCCIIVLPAGRRLRGRPMRRAGRCGRRR